MIRLRRPPPSASAEARRAAPAPGGAAAPARRAKAPRLGLRSHLLALALAVLLPALAVGAAAAWQAVASYRAAFEAHLQDTARAFALALDARIGADLGVLTALAAAPAFDAGADPAAREALLRRAGASIGTDIALVDPATRRYLVHTAVPPGAPTQITGMADAVSRVLDTGRPVVADLTVSATTGRLAAGPAVPVAREGRVLGVLAARTEPAALLELLRGQNLPEDGSAVLVDGQGRIVARTRDVEAAFGQPAPGWFLEARAGQARGMTSGPDLFGTVSLGAFERLPVAPGWTITVFVPRAAHVWSWARPLGTLVAGAVPLLLLSAALALWLARRLLRPVEALRRRARAVAGGGQGYDPGMAAAPAGGAPDAAAGVAEFEGLRADIAAAEAALRRSEAEFRAMFEGTLVGMAQAATASGRFLRVNRRFCEIVGYGEAELLGGTTFLDLTHPEDRAKDVAGFRAAMATTGRYEVEKRYVRKDGAVTWVAVHVALVPGAGDAAATGDPARTVAAVQDITARKRAEERQTLLAREVDHRAKNALAVVQAALRLTKAEDVPGYRWAVEGRVAALARAQTLLARDRWSGADLRALLRGELAPFVDGAGPRAELDGPPVALPAGAAQPLAMAVHELATNAVKHGALSAPAGRVSASWRLGRGPAGGEDVLRLRWAEAGGPPVAGPSQRPGFGTRVLDATVRHQLGGALSLDWRATGLVCEMEVPLRRVPGTVARRR